jgi:hypothetical protein
VGVETDSQRGMGGGVKPGSNFVQLATHMWSRVTLEKREVETIRVFPHPFSIPSVAWAAGLNPAATLSNLPPKCGPE